jgi:pyridoxine 4-dehydrogenase
MTASSTRPGGVGRLGSQSVARIGYGAMQLEKSAHSDRAAAIALLRAAAERGVDHIDTAAFYGPGTVNALLSEALHPYDGITVVTKVGAISVEGGPVPLALAQKPGELRAQIDDNLRTLGVERLDVVNLRRADGGLGLRAEGDQIVPMEDQLAVLIELRDAGVVGAIGVSNVTPEQVRTALPAGIVCVQNADNPLHRDPAFDLAREHDVAWVPYFPLGSAFDRLPNVADRPEVQDVAARLGVTAAQVALAWQLARWDGTLLIPGTRSIAHLEENLGAGDVVLDDDAMTVLDGLAPREVR